MGHNLGGERMRIRSGVIGMAVFVSVFMMGVAAWALQAGGVEVGDLESGSVVGQRFKELSVDLDIHATEIGAQGALSSGVGTGSEVASRKSGFAACDQSVHQRAGVSHDDGGESSGPNGIECATRTQTGREQVYRHPHQRSALCRWSHLRLSRSSQPKRCRGNAAPAQIGQVFAHGKSTDDTSAPCREKRG